MRHEDVFVSSSLALSDKIKINYMRLLDHNTHVQELVYSYLLGRSSLSRLGESDGKNAIFHIRFDLIVLRKTDDVKGNQKAVLMAYLDALRQLQCA